MNIHQTRVALEARPAPGPSPDLEPYIGVFHGWIRDDQVAGLVPIDVADSRHLRDRPRVLLVAHHGTLCVDRLSRGGLSLSFTRKRDAVGPAVERISEGLREVARAAQLLEADPVVGPRLHFRRDAVEVSVHSRLVATDSAEDAAHLIEAVREVALAATGAPAAVSWVAGGPLGVSAELGAALDLDALIWGEAREAAHG